MKNNIIFLIVVCLLTTTKLSAQMTEGALFCPKGEVKTSAMLFCGANVLEPAPVYGAAFILNCSYVRAEIEVGGSYIDLGFPFSRKHLVYFSPSFGLAYHIRNICEIYLMASWINWGTTELSDVPEEPGRFKRNRAHGRIKAGTSFDIGKKMFANIDIAYMFPRGDKEGYRDYDNLTVRAGVGYRF